MRVPGGLVHAEVPELVSAHTGPPRALQLVMLDHFPVQRDGAWLQSLQNVQLLLLHVI